MEFVDIEDICSVSSISKYYNLISLLPIKIVTDFLNIDINISSSIASSKAKNNTEKQNKKNDKATTANTDFAFTSFNSTTLIQSYNKLVKNNLLGTINDYNFYCSNFEMMVCLLSFLLVFVFKGSMVLARGDTENNIIINKIGNKVIRLV